MTLGEKIRTYRMLKGLTQKELGMLVGFSAATADSRIRKYEKDLMAPKADLRSKIADALDVDISALSDNNISSPEDVMQSMFNIEKQYGAQVIKTGDKVSLIFDLSDSKNDLLNSYMNIWADRYLQYTVDNDYPSYQSWEAQFPGEIPSEWNDLRTEILDKFKDIINQKEYSQIQISSLKDFAMHVFKLMRNNITFDVDYIQASSHGADKKKWDGLRFSFSAEELVGNTSPEYNYSFALFLKDISVIEQMRYSVKLNIFQANEGHKLVIYVRDPDLVSLIPIYQKYLLPGIESENNKPEWATKSIEEIIESNLDVYDGKLLPNSKF